MPLVIYGFGGGGGGGGDRHIHWQHENDLRNQAHAGCSICAWFNNKIQMCMLGLCDNRENTIIALTNIIAIPIISFINSRLAHVSYKKENGRRQ